MQNLLEFLDALEHRKIHYLLERNRSEALMVRIDVPGEHWEVEFFADGEVEVEVFRSTGRVIGGPDAAAALKRLIEDHRY